jgi:class 3 adenylate cyclase/predicted ATPase
MTFDEVLTQVVELLQREGRVSYRALKIRFNIDEEYIEGIKDELIAAKRLAVDEEGKVLVWIEASPVQSFEVKVPSSTQSLEAERRQLTVMFCDLVGSTALSEQLDPEELREIVRIYQNTCAEVITRFEGHIAQYLGDGVLVYFGYPAAHEDDAARAVRVGLEIVEALQRQVPSPLAGEGQGEGVKVNTIDTPHPNLPPQGGKELRRLQVRIGIHTGLVVVGEMGGGDKREQLALGDTPNIAARIQGLAAPDTVVMSAATYRLVEGLFDCHALGPQTLKGISIPLPVYRLVRESDVQSRFDVTVRAGLTPLVGREDELEQLRACWERAKAEHGQVVLLSGEAGIGKSRLLQELKDTVGRDDVTRIEFRCSPYYQHTAFYPVIDHLQRLLRFTREDSPQEKLAKLEHLLQHYSAALQDTLPLLAALLSLPHPESYPPLNLTPQKQRQRTQEALWRWLAEEAERKPVLAVWEDLHWADPSTLELHRLFMNHMPTTRMLTILTARPEFTSPWKAPSWLTSLTLVRLGQVYVETMVRQITDGKIVPREVLQQIVSKTDGVPLFVDELTRPLPPLAIPTTLQDSLMARLDRLSAVREVVQLGATLGREFSYELLRAVSPMEESVLRNALEQLLEAEILYQRGLPPSQRYVFKHALLQDAAYQSLLKSRRQQYHQQIAQVLEERFGEVKEAQPELLAHHYTEAGLIGQAIGYWQQAGQNAIQRSANIEAITHLSRGLVLLNALPESPERVQQELTLQITLGKPLIATKGFTVPETGRAFGRALELCRQIGETPQLFPVLVGLRMFYAEKGELQTARELGEQLLRLAERERDTDLLLEAHYALGVPLYWQGEFSLARIHFEQGVSLYNFQQHRSHAFRYGVDPGVGCLCYLGWTLLTTGFLDQALPRHAEAITLAQNVGHPFSLGFAVVAPAVVHLLRQESLLVQKQAEATITLCKEQGFPYFLAAGTIFQGWALVNESGTEEGITQMQQGLAAWQAMGTEMIRPWYLALLADAYGKVGRLEEGLRSITEALAFADKNGERMAEAVLYRLKGELTLRQFKVQGSKLKVKNLQSVIHNPQLETEEYFLKAIDIARQQGAKLWELRATMSLARLWQRQGKQHEAHTMLSEIYGWFTEGFDTKDLQEAQVLLEELV